MHVIVGAGAVGLFLAARMSVALSPTRVMLLSRHLQPSRRAALTYTPLGATSPLSIPLRIIEPKDIGSLSKMQHLRFIICSKAYDAVPLLEMISANVQEPCSVCMLSNGCLSILGELDQSTVDDRTRSNLLIGTLTHGCRLHSSLNVEHTGAGSIALGLGDESNEAISEEAAELASMFNVCGLNAMAFSGHDLHIKCWEKLIINCAINPVTAILREPNACILDPIVQQTYVIPLVQEACAVMSVAAPELVQTVTHTTRETLEQHMLRRVIEVATATRANKSSTLQDIERGAKTELDHISGFLLSRGFENGLYKHDMQLTERVINEVQCLEKLTAMTMQ